MFYLIQSASIFKQRNNSVIHFSKEYFKNKTHTYGFELFVFDLLEGIKAIYPKFKITLFLEELIYLHGLNRVRE